MPTLSRLGYARSSEAPASLDQRPLQLQRYKDVIAAPAELHGGRGEPVSRSILVDHLMPDTSRPIADLLESGALGVLGIRSVGGAVADVPADATAYAGRTANFLLAALGAHDAALDQAWAPVGRPAVGAYISFETQLNARRLRQALRQPSSGLAVKRRVDPRNVFHDNIDLGRFDDD